jgi:AcrR family transcriptional regulator
MKKYTKGEHSRERIVNTAKELFNEHGIGMTLNALANAMEITLGMLTYHFPTKDSIFLAIAEEYEKQRTSLRIREYTGKFSIGAFYQIIGRAMDLQYEYRCAMRYIVSISNNRSELSNHTISRYKFNTQVIQQAVSLLVEEGELKSTILEEKNFKVFLFAFTNLTTSWLINLELYDRESTYEEMKSVYLQGIFSSFLPYCTEKGEKCLENSSI